MKRKEMHPLHKQNVLAIIINNLPTDDTMLDVSMRMKADFLKVIGH